MKCMTLAVVGALCSAALFESAPANPVDSLVAYWPLDDHLLDAARTGGTNDDGSWNGSEGWGPGRFGNGLVLNGSNYISIPSSSDVDRSGGDISVSAWFTVAQWDTSWQCLIAKGEGDRWRVHRHGGNNAAMAYAGGTGDIAGGSVNDGQWHHVVAVSEAGVSTRLLVDGVLVASGGGPGLGSSGQPVMIGENPDATNRRWKGSVDDVGIFSIPLNEHQARAIYELGIHPEYQYFLARVNRLLVTHACGPGSTVDLGDTTWQYAAADPGGGRYFVQLGVDGSGMAASTGPAISAFGAIGSKWPGGQPLTLRWSVGTDATSLTIDQGIGDVLPLTAGGSGQITLDPGPLVNTTYTLSASNASGTNTKSFSVEVTDQPIIDFFTASQSVVEPNAAVTLDWNVRNTVSLDLNGTDVTDEMQRVVNPAASITYTLTATNANGTTVVEIPITVVVPGEPIISEFNADNIGVIQDEDGDTSDWIELTNPTGTSSILDDYYLTDDPDDLRKWKIPFQVLSDGETLLIFASGKDRAVAGRELHTNFSLRASGEYLALVKFEDGSPVILSEFDDYPRQFEDISFGVAADGLTTGYFTSPTPDRANGVILTDYVRDTMFTPDRGFYTQPFRVEISSNTPGASFRYTLDGSEPSPTSGTLYTGPITISRTTTLRAIGFKQGYLPTNVDAHTYLFLDDVIRQPEMDPEIVNNPAYAGTIKDDLMSIPTMSIVTKNEHLFGASGIYSNPTSSGVAWERPTSMEIFHPDGRAGRQVNCGIRIYGGVGRNPGFQKHTFRLLFKRQYGPTKLEYPLFDVASEDAEGATDRFDTIIMRAGFNNAWHRGSSSEEQRAQYLRDQWMHDSQLAMGHASCHGIFVHLYLNGTYWGVYNVVERPNADFGSSYYGGKKEEWDALNSYPRNVVDGTATAWQTAHTIANGGVTSQAAYDNLAQYVDMENLIDYMLLNFYGGNLDWDDHNWYSVRHRVPGAGYKFVSWDAERTLESISGDNRTGVGQSDKPSRLFSQLKQNDEFRMKFADHAHRHLFNDGALTPVQAGARYQTLANVIDRAIVGESARWGDSQRSAPYTRDGEWVTERDRLLRQYFPARTAAVLGHLRGHNPRLFPNTDAPVFSQHGGHVTSSTQLTMTNSSGQIYYTKDGSDPRLPGGAVNPSALSYDGAVSATTLVPAGATWQFLDDGSDQGTAWRNPGFNDAAWDSGPAELGYGDGGEATEVSFGGNGSDKHMTTYFRHQFTAQEVAEFTSMILQVRRDDGFVAYLNGQFLEDDNMPGGAIDYQTRSAGTVGGADENTFFSFAVPLTNLQEGVNTLAVEIHQTSPTSSDISFDLVLKATKPNTVNPLTMTETGMLKARALDGSEWSALNEALFVVDAEVASIHNLVISEVNYRPLGPTPQEEEAGLNSRSDFEFIQLTNIGAVDLDLTNVRFNDGVTFNFNDSPYGFILPAGQSVVIVNNITGFRARYPSVPASIIAGEYSGNLSDDGEQLVLLATDDSILRDFTYNDKLPWPEAADGEGKTLTLANPFSNPDHSDPLNWRASVADGGSPGGFDGTGFVGTPNADDDRDHLTALAEYAFGSSDADGLDAPFPVGAIETLDVGGADEDFFTISYRRNLSADDVEFRVQVSDDLVTWREGAGHVEFVRRTNNGDGTETVTYRSAAPLGAALREFLRVLVTLP